MVLNKSLQVGILMVCVAKLNAELIKTTGDQRAKYECRACGTDVQELPVKRVVPSGRSVHHTTLTMMAIHCHMLSFSTNDDNDDSHRQPEGAGVISQRVFRTIVVQHMGTRMFG